MSSSSIHANSSSPWKQEVNRRLAEHRERKPATAPEPQAPAAAPPAVSRRAQEAAARVAARYANAPSYNDLLAAEARAALRAAEAATEAALQAQAAAESILAGIEAAAAAPPAVAPPATPKPAPPPELLVKSARKKEHIEDRADESQTLTIRWAPEMPSLPAAPAEIRAGQGQSQFEDEGWKPASAEPVGPGAGDVAMVEPAQPIQGNLIEFPRELVAARKVRPRLVESPGAHSSAQLSIFEVDPATVATELSAETLEASSAAWSQPGWSGIELDAQPRIEEAVELLEEPVHVRERAHPIHPASLNRWLMAVAVDGLLITGSMIGAAALALNLTATLPGPRTVEMALAVALAAISACYATLFCALAAATPGMRYAGIRFSTFDGHAPTRAQRWGRLGAMLLSVLPAGLGFAWALFDDDHLSWHDRLSRTYIRNR